MFYGKLFEDGYRIDKNIVALCFHTTHLFDYFPLARGSVVSLYNYEI